MVKYVGDEEELAKWLEAERELIEQPIPKGWITVDQFLKSRKPPISRRTALEHLNRLVEAEYAEKQPWVKNGHRIAIYRLTHSRNGKR